MPPFEPVHRLRRVELVAPHAVDLDTGATGPVLAPDGGWPLPSPAAYVGVLATLAPGTRQTDLAVGLTSGPVRLTGHLDARGRTALEVTGGEGRTTQHRSRRHGRVRGTPLRVGLLLTGGVLALLVDTTGADDGSGWRAHARVDLPDRGVPTGGPGFSAGLRVHLEAAPGAVDRLVAGGAGRLGLRDVRAVTAADGTPLREGRRLWLTATCAGPGFAVAAHQGVFLLDPVEGTVEHTADLFTTRAGDDRVHGDHATHLLQDPGSAHPTDPGSPGAGWLAATSTWGGFVAGRPGHRVDAGLARTAVDPRRGRHVLATTPLALPVEGLGSVGTWDPHLLHRDGRWEVGFVSARAYFRFHPAWATGPALEALTLRGADPARTATEGATLVDLGGTGGGTGSSTGLHLLASDGRDGPRGLRARYPVLDETVREVGALEAPYPSNIPWPTLVRATRDVDGHDGWWLMTFDGTPAAGPLPGYGTHGDLVVMRAVAAT